MDARTNRLFLLILIALYVFLGMHFKPWKDLIGNNHLPDLLLALSSMLALIGLIFGCLGLIFNKNTRIMCLIANGVYLIIGSFATYLSWTFWIFHEPTFTEKIQNTTPAFFLGILMPVFLLYYFAKVEIEK